MRTVTIGTTAFLVEDSHHTDRHEHRAGRRTTSRSPAKRGADILCLPEMVSTVNVPERPGIPCRRIPGRDHRRPSAVPHGRTGSMSIAPYLVRAGKKVFNQATVIDRNGKIVGFYRKVQPTAEESHHVSSREANSRSSIWTSAGSR